MGLFLTEIITLLIFFLINNGKLMLRIRKRWLEEISQLSTTLRKDILTKMVPLKYLAKNNPEERLVVFSFKYKNGK